MSFTYAVRESLSGFKRARLSSVISVITISISLVLLGVFVIFTINAARFIDAVRDKVELEAFIQEPISKEATAQLQTAVAAISGVERVEYISKEQAARIFEEEFGKDILSVLDFNPLPPSFRIRLTPGYKTSDSVQTISNKVSALQQIASVRYNKGLLELIDKRTQTVNQVTLGLGILISLSAIFLVSNTIRLAIYAKRRLLKTMELVGATASFIRLPFLLEGAIQGVFGGVLAAAVMYGFVEYGMRLFSKDLLEFVRMDPVFYTATVAAGILLGLVGSTISIIRFIRLTD
jgi:cell division transport system permease protein